MEKKFGTAVITECSYNLLAIQDALDVISGKWKIPVICILRLKEKLCFNDIIREIEGISAKALTKVLRELEDNELVKRATLDTKPIMVEYQLTDYGNTLEKVIFEILDWVLTHRKRITGKDSLAISSTDYVMKIRSELPKVYNGLIRPKT